MKSLIFHVSHFFRSERAMNILRETQRILRVHEITPKKRLGQNFLVDVEILHKMISYAQIAGDEVVLEIGAGLGYLTQLLSERCRQVIAVEADPRLAEILRKRLSNKRNVTIVQSDILELAPTPFNKVVSTPPYSISSPLLFWLLDKGFECAVLTFQREFADRLVAQTNSRDYSRLTVTTSYRADVELLDCVSRKVFWPPPKVDSVVVRLKLRKRPFAVKDEKMFFEIIQVLFTQKNRKVKNAIRPFLDGLKISEKDAEEWLNTLPFINRRPRELAAEDFAVLADEIRDRIRGKDFP